MSPAEADPGGPASWLLQHRLARFLLVGSINTAVDVALYAALALIRVPVVPANLVSTSCGLLVSYLLNRRFVFRAGSHPSRRARLRRVGLFLVTTGFGLWVLQPVLILAVGGLLAPSASGAVLVLVPKVAATVVTTVWNYASYSLVVFRGRPVPSPSGTVEPAPPVR